VRKEELRKGLASLDRREGEGDSGIVTVCDWDQCIKDAFPKSNYKWTNLHKYGEVFQNSQGQLVQRGIPYEQFIEKLDTMRSGDKESMMASVGQFQILFRFLDRDNDGKITKDDFEHFWLPIKKELKSAGIYEELMADYDEAQLKQNLIGAFQSLDCDHDGTLTLAELLKHDTHTPLHTLKPSPDPAPKPVAPEDNSRTRPATSPEFKSATSAVPAPRVDPVAELAPVPEPAPVTEPTAPEPTTDPVRNTARHSQHNEEEKNQSCVIS